MYVLTKSIYVFTSVVSTHNLVQALLSLELDNVVKKKNSKVLHRLCIELKFSYTIYKPLYRLYLSTFHICYVFVYYILA